MARVPLQDPDELTGYLRELHDESDDNTPLLPTIAQAFAPAPDLLESFAEWYFPWHSNTGEQPTRLPTRLKELVRLRLATFTGCRACKSARLDEGEVTEAEALGVDTEVAEGFSEEERAAIAFAEKLALDHHSIDDQDFERLRRHFDDAQLLELVVLSGVIYVGWGRALSVLALDDPSCELPPLHFERG